jgi:hypothetical protein
VTQAAVEDGTVVKIGNTTMTVRLVPHHVDESGWGGGGV